MSPKDIRGMVENVTEDYEVVCPNPVGKDNSCFCGVNVAEDLKVACSNSVRKGIPNFGINEALDFILRI